MWKSSRLIALAGVLELSSLPARAQDAETIADVRCIVVGVRIAGIASSSNQAAGTMLAMYYIGRLDGRVPKLNLEDLMVEEVGKMTSADYGSETTRCGNNLTAKGQQIAQIGKDIMERGQKMLDKPITPAK